MAQATFHFPRGFLWGTATASHQVEGNNTNNNWSAWEQTPGHVLQGDTCGPACDWWGGRWREDFDRAAEGSQNSLRLSVEWSRVQPESNRWDEAALDRYRDMMRGLLERGMMPLVTLHHFTDPLWVSKLGGWENEAIIGYFEAYVRKVVEALREYVTLWVTINEPTVLIGIGYFTGLWPPGKTDLGLLLKAATHVVRAHAAAYKAIHSLQPQARVGMAHNLRAFTPARSWSPLDRFEAGIRHRYFNEIFPTALTTGRLNVPFLGRRIPEAAHTQDFLGINYYTRDYVAFDLFRPKELFGRNFFKPGADLSPNGFIANEPQGFYDMVHWGVKYNLPILITENGVEDAEDHLRPRYIVQHLHQLWRAVNFNFPVKGYFHWTLVDNFEWERGWQQRFGLWELDPQTQARRKRPSASLYAEICRENGISSEMVGRYTPELFNEMFPN